MAMPLSNADQPVGAWDSPARPVDIRNAYRILLGRPVESLESVKIKMTMTVGAMVEELLCSDEFVQFIETPLLESGEFRPWLYDGFPRPRLLEWVAATLPLGAGKRRVLKALTWREALEAIYSSPAFIKYLKSRMRLSHLTALGEILAPAPAPDVVRAPARKGAR